MELHDIEHFSRIVAGCESVTEHLDCNVGMSEEGRYTYAVLQLHAQDEGLVDGTEGFIDSIKKGAKNIKEWFLALLNSIMNFIGEVTGRNKKKREQEEEIARKEKEVKEDKEKAIAYEEKLVALLKSSFAEPLRLSEQAYEDIGTTGLLDRDSFSALNVSNLRIHSGYGAIRGLNLEIKHAKDSNTRAISKELEDLKLAITELTYESKRQVNKWAEDEEQSQQRRDITAAGTLLKKFTQVLGWYEDGLSRYLNTASKINN